MNGIVIDRESGGKLELDENFYSYTEYVDASNEDKVIVKMLKSN